MPHGDAANTKTGQRCQYGFAHNQPDKPTKEGTIQNQSNHRYKNEKYITHKLYKRFHNHMFFSLTIIEFSKHYKSPLIHIVKLIFCICYFTIFAIYSNHINIAKEKIVQNFIVEDGAQIAQDVKIGYNSIIKSGAKIGAGTIIGDFCYIDKDVSIGENNYIGTAVHIKGKTTIGNNNHILDNTVIGLSGKHIGYHFYQGKVIIGNNNFINNNCSIDCGNNHLSDSHPELLAYSLVDAPGAENEDATIIGNRCYILNNVIIHHNCRVGLGDLPDSNDPYDTVICSGCCLNGFVQVRKGAELSSGTYIREFSSLGEGCFTSMMSHIVKDVAPFCNILKNKNIGTIERLVTKFRCSTNDVEKLRSNFSSKRSGILKIY